MARNNNSAATRLRFTTVGLLFLAVVTTIAASGCSKQDQPAIDPLPPLADIASMEVEIESGAGIDKGKFAVAQQHWQAICDALRPAERDAGRKSIVLGDLTLTRKSGKPIQILLFEAGEPGAFAIGETENRNSASDGRFKHAALVLRLR